MIQHVITKPDSTQVLNWAVNIPDSKVHGANMGPAWVLSAPDGPHVGPMNLAIRASAVKAATGVWKIIPPANRHFFWLGNQHIIFTYMSQHEKRSLTYYCWLRTPSAVSSVGRHKLRETYVIFAYQHNNNRIIIWKSVWIFTSFGTLRKIWWLFKDHPDVRNTNDDNLTCTFDKYDLKLEKKLFWNVAKFWF